jgi:hypothetical protein
LSFDIHTRYCPVFAFTDRSFAATLVTADTFLLHCVKGLKG